MRSLTPALIVCIAGVALMIGAAVAWATSPPNVHHARRATAAPVVITPASTEPAAVSFASADLPQASVSASLSRGGQAT